MSNMSDMTVTLNHPTLAIRNGRCSRKMQIHRSVTARLTRNSPEQPRSRCSVFSVSSCSTPCWCPHRVGGTSACCCNFNNSRIPAFPRPIISANCVSLKVASSPLPCTSIIWPSAFMTRFKSTSAAASSV